jgi:hypothetical protein
MLKEGIHNIHYRISDTDLISILLLSKLTNFFEESGSKGLKLFETIEKNNISIRKIKDAINEAKAT